MPIFDHFSLLAPFYDRAIKAAFPQKLISLLDLPTAGYVLDAGGGTGRIAQFLKSNFESIVIADSSMEMLQQAAQKNCCGLVCSNTESLPFPDGLFARILMVDALHHVTDHQKTIDELWRLLKPGGRLVIEEMDYNQPLVKLVALAEKIALMRSHFLSPQAITRLFPSDGVDIRIECSDRNAWIIVDKVNR